MEETKDPMPNQRKPAVSVIVPVYKVEPYLNCCIDSILAQTFTDFELILVNDGSPDNCGAICDEYVAKDDRVVVIHQENAGVSAARNAGIDWVRVNSNSEWITFVDSDDAVISVYLEVLYRYATETSADIVATSGFCFYEDEELRNWIWQDGDVEILEGKQCCIPFLWGNAKLLLIRGESYAKRNYLRNCVFH